MARLQSWDAFDLRLLDFNDQFEAASGRYFLGDANLTLDGMFYPQALALEYPGIDVNWVLFYLGSGMTITNGAIAGGTLTAYYQFFNIPPDTDWFYNLQWTGFSVSATAFARAQLSETHADDNAIFSKMLGGADTIIMSAYSDYMEGRGGNDKMSGGGGNDTLIGGAGADSLTGGTGADVLSGSAGADRLNGGAGVDRLAGGPGDDVLTGGTGLTRDVFVFSVSGGNDRITDFQDHLDRIEITSGATAFNQLTIVRDGTATLVTFADVSIHIDLLAPAALTAADFLFT